jgi:NAD(P)H-hydrate epimerase
MDIPAITRDQMIEVDRLMIDSYGILLIQMMENAGIGLAEMARRMMGGVMIGRRVIVLCGAGNNGGGGMVAARHLNNRGANVRIRLVGNQERLKEVPAHQWRILDKMGVQEAQTSDLEGTDLVVDAIIGYGLTGNIRGTAAEWVGIVNQSERPVLSLDAPTGLDATLGAPGQVCIQADTTLTLALPKAGLMGGEVRSYVGDLYLADIGVPPGLYNRLGMSVGTLFEKDAIIRIF